jgi:hypothetical protein
MCENGLLFFRSFVGVVLNVLFWIWHVIAVESIINVLKMYPNLLVQQLASRFRIYGALNSRLGLEIGRLEIFVGFLAPSV